MIDINGKTPSAYPDFKFFIAIALLYIRKCFGKHMLCFHNSSIKPTKKCRFHTKCVKLIICSAFFAGIEAVLRCDSYVRREEDSIKSANVQQRPL